MEYYWQKKNAFMVLNKMVPTNIESMYGLFTVSNENEWKSSWKHIKLCAIFIFNIFMRFFNKSLHSAARFTHDKHEKLMENVWLHTKTNAQNLWCECFTVVITPKNSGEMNKNQYVMYSRISHAFFEICQAFTFTSHRNICSSFYLRDKDE